MLTPAKNNIVQLDIRPAVTSIVAFKVNLEIYTKKEIILFLTTVLVVSKECLNPKYQV